MNRHVGSEAISSFSLDCGAGFGWILKGSTPDIEGAALLTITSGDHYQPSISNAVLPSPSLKKTLHSPQLDLHKRIIFFKIYIFCRILGWVDHQNRRITTTILLLCWFYADLTSDFFWRQGAGGLWISLVNIFKNVPIDNENLGNYRPLSLCSEVLLLVNSGSKSPLPLVDNLCASCVDRLSGSLWFWDFLTHFLLSLIL